MLGHCCVAVASDQNAEHMMAGAAHNSVGLQLFESLSAVDQDHNIIVSPRSLDTALGLLYLGSAGVTRTELGTALGISAEERLEPFSTIAAPGVNFRSTSSLWTRPDIILRPTFVAAAEHYCDAQVRLLPNEGAVAAINSWVASSTEGTIREVISSVGPSVAVILINAAYFHGGWTATFDPVDTKNGPFTLADGQQKTVSFMRKEGMFIYWHGANYDWIRLPYGDGTVAMDLLLPHVGTPILSLIKTLVNVGTPKSQVRPELAAGALQLPRFTAKSALSLDKVLSSMGLKSLFNLGIADFSRLTSSSTHLAIDEVRHSVFIAVDEAGTVASAATSITMIGSAAIQAQRFSLRFDRPFLFSIRNTHDGSLLFVGVIRDPDSQ